MAQGDYWVMMDGDLSHRPQDLPALLKVLKDADIVVGSRYISGGGVKNWPLHRNLVSRVASAVSRILVGLEVRDPTSGFGAFRKVTLEPILPSLNPRGFKLLLEILANSGEAVVREVPITFVDRRCGRSKLGWKEYWDFMVSCGKLHRFR